MFIRNGALVIISRVRNFLIRFNSLRIYVFLGVILIGIIPVLILRSILMDTSTNTLVNDRYTNLQNTCIVLTNQITSSSYLVNYDNKELEAEMEIAANIFDGRIMLVNDSFKIVIDTNEVDKGRTNISDKVINCFKGENFKEYNAKERYIEMTLPVVDSSTNRVLGVIVATSSTNTLLPSTNKLNDKSQILILVLIIILAVLAFLLSYSVGLPFKKIERDLEKVRDDDLSVDITPYGYVEIKKITKLFNKIIKKLQDIDASRQVFVSNVSHELKTPITSIRVLADSLIAQENVPVEIYREFMTDISEEIDRENKIIEDLLTLVRLDKTGTVMNIAKKNINELLELMLKRLKPIAQQRNIELTMESLRPVTAEIDEVKLTLAISNLIENAIKYNVEGGWVRVSLNADHKFFFIKVSDSGVGIPDDAVGHVFERFYRVDKARSRDTGGTGLGLAITKDIIQHHNGAIRVHSKLHEGTTFNVRIPLTHVE